jgi:CRP-like cAMP-binding protein
VAYPYAAERPVVANAFLAALDPDARTSFLRSARRLQLTVGQSLPVSEAQAVYLPESGLVSLLWSGPDARVAETAVVDRQGAVGLVEALAETPIGFASRALTSGTGLMVSGGAMRALVEQDEAAAAAAWRCAACAVREARHAAACRALHTVHARLADTLLDYAERINDYDRLPVTHEVLSWSLGVCRTTVTAVIRELSDQQLIITGRSRIALADPYALDRLACGCRKPSRLTAAAPAVRRSISAVAMAAAGAHP